MRFIILGALFFLLLSCYQPERDCKKFKTGKFEFKALVGTELQTTTFVRNDSIEIDYYKGKADTSSIRWINNCEYIVQKINPKSQAEKKAIHMKILTTEGDKYTFEYNVVGEQNKQKGTAVKVGSQ
ncbi:DNA topoisomerase IV [Marixanthomonas spongiae]|uniref:DNA topoisomerase IV n=1 Tax=Marixanthomonas spongiae TaxID=2174845 RepID=A0A2U0HYQ6_9FLAO|nr:DNA topoisomerase IV [Marixanthomonas spongiae]PVW13966.1 DNA topoisomerase IV [Marixanthomonas spongiae]